MTESLERSIGSVEAKVDILLERSSGFDKRLLAVENKVSWASGVAYAASGLAAVTLGFLAKIKLS